MAKDAVKEGLIQGWALLKRVPGMGKVEDEKINFLWVVAYESPKKYVNRQNWSCILLRGNPAKGVNNYYVPEPRFDKRENFKFKGFENYL